MKSRFAIIGALAAMLLALLYVAPALASTSWDTVGSEDDLLGISVYDPAEGAKDSFQIGTSTEDLDENDVLDPILSTSFQGSNFLGNRDGNSQDAEYTKVGNTVWVATAPGLPWGPGLVTDPGSQPFSLVYVWVDSGDNTNAPTVEVTNTTAKKSVTANRTVMRDGDSGRLSPVMASGGEITLVNSGGSGTWEGYFFVVKNTNDVPAGHPAVEGSDGDTITVEYGNRLRRLRVDGVAPTIGSTSPAHNHIQTSTVATLSATITDSGSGIAPDVANEEDNSGANGGNADGDTDGVTQEPRAKSDGAARDIQILTGNDPDDAVTFLDDSDNATSDWTPASTGNGYKFSYGRGGLTTADGDGQFYWQVTAVDRVNNRAMTDSNARTTAKEAFLIQVDVTTPGMGSAQAGVGYNAVTKKDNTNDPRSIKVTFTDKGAKTTADNADNLDGTTVDASDFRVDESSRSTNVLAIASVTHPNHDSDTTGASDTRNVVYITLENPLAPDARPQVNLIGDIRDRAGWAAPPQDIVATEEIKPSFTVTVSGAAGERPVVTGATTDKAIISITSTEALTSAPTVNLLAFELTASAGVQVADLTPVTASPVGGSSNTSWEVQAVSSTSGLRGVWVSGSDSAGNVGTTGGTTGALATASVDLTKVTLFEFDNNLAAPKFTLTPTSSAGPNSTESSNPFLRINFDEGKEYNLTGATTARDSVEVGPPPVTNVEVDSHDAVTLTKLTITDSAGVTTDLLGQEGSVTSDSFIIALSDLALGTYTVHVNGTDAAGNTLKDDASHALHVVARSAFKVKLSPGWNLVSVPGDPSDPSLDSVLPSSHPATTVLSYAPNDPNGPWLTATRAAGMDWSDNASNTLSEIRAGHGYWVETGTFTPLSTLIPERPAAAVPPTYAVSAGWNLLGVTDVTLAQEEFGVVSYLASTDWSVAYTYNTQANSWAKHSNVPTNTDKVAVGKGLWVYMKSDGALAP